jgi:8-oxo-dGTP diphosphatase
VAPLPQLRNASGVTDLEVVAAVFVRGDSVLGCRRSPGRSAAGQWEFPGGKVEPGEDPKVALRREVSEELGLDVTVGELLDRSSTVVGELVIDLSCYKVTLVTGEPITSTDHDVMIWINCSDVLDIDWAKPDLPMVRKIALW